VNQNWTAFIVVACLVLLASDWAYTVAQGGRAAVSNVIILGTSALIVCWYAAATYQMAVATTAMANAATAAALSIREDVWRDFPMHASGITSSGPAVARDVAITFEGSTYSIADYLAPADRAPLPEQVYSAQDRELSVTLTWREPSGRQSRCLLWRKKTWRPCAPE